MYYNLHEPFPTRQGILNRRISIFSDLESPFFLSIERYSSKHRRVLTESSDPSLASLTKWDGPGGFINSIPFFLSVPLDDAMELYRDKRNLKTPV
jgi:hypothetical protein